jgi:hypothetical protein
MNMPAKLEAVTPLCFGLAWPLAGLKMLHTGRAEGRWLPFTLVIFAGDAVGLFFKQMGFSSGSSLSALRWQYLLNTLPEGVNATAQWKARGRRIHGRLTRAEIDGS